MLRLPLSPALIGLAAGILLVGHGWAAPVDDGGIRFGTDEAIVSQVLIAEEQQVALAQETKLGPWSAGFAYRRAFVIHESFALWTWHGRFLLHCGDNVIDLPREQLDQFIGPTAASQLSTPLVYRLPPGLISLLGIGVLIGVCVRLFPSRFGQVEHLMRDTRYQQAVEVYQSSLPPPADEVSVSHRREALGHATEFLAERSIPHAQAERNLRIILGLREELRSRELRAEAVLHEQAGEWDEALDLFEEVAELRELWDPKDHEYLKKCIARVERKQSSES